jgi:glycosyltransferase involved in cell wall biosynthesis
MNGNPELRILRIGVVDWLLRHRGPGQHEVVRDLGKALGRVDYLVYSTRRAPWAATAITPYSTVYPTRSLSKLHFFADAWRIGNKLQQEVGYSLITSADPMGAGLIGFWLSRRYSIPWLVTCHSDYFSTLEWRLESPRYWFDYYLSIYLLRRATLVHTVSHKVGQEVIRLGVAPDRVCALPNIRRTRIFGPGEMGLDRYRQGKLIFAGRLAKEKGIATLLRAMRILLDAGYSLTLRLVGGGPQYRRLEALVDRLRLTPWVEFVDRVSPEELVGLYQQSSMLVLPSNREAFGWVLAEAGMCGLPVVASDVGGVREIVDQGETGLLVPPRDPQKLAGAIARLLDDPALAMQMGARAVGQRDRWEYTRLVEAHCALLRRAAGKE